MDNSQSDDKKACNAKLEESVTLTETESQSIKPYGKSGPLVAKIPVVIAEPKIQIDVESEIRLNEPALEIKRIKKNVFLTQCKLLYIWDDKDDGIGDGIDDDKDGGKADGKADGKHGDKKDNKHDDKCDKKSKHDGCKHGKLFVSGFVRKNIEYSTLECKCLETRCVSGDIIHTTCNIPFKFVTKITFDIPPEIYRNGPALETETSSAEFKLCDYCAQPVTGRDPCEQNFSSFEVFNEKVYCELEYAEILEEDIHKDSVPLDGEWAYDHTFDTLTEKMVIFLKLKLLQKQQVKIPYYHDKKD